MWLCMQTFEHVLGTDQYFPPGTASIPSNRLFAQFPAPQTNEMKREILKQLCLEKGIGRVVFAAVAIGMAVDISDIRQVIHIGPPSSLKAYVQETGHAGRDENPSSAWLYYITTKTLPRIERECKMICEHFA